MRSMRVLKKIILVKNIVNVKKGETGQEGPIGNNEKKIASGKK